MPIIDPSNLRSARKRQKWTQNELAKKIGVSKRQVAEWERKRPEDQPISIRQKNFNALLEKLQITESELKGVTQISKISHKQSTLKIAKKIYISKKTLMYFDLLYRHHGLSLDQLVEITPLLFAVLAEQSIEWRKEQLVNAKKAAMQILVKQSALLPPELLSQKENLLESWKQEEQNIKNKQVFSPSRVQDESGKGTSNRFTDFIYHVLGVEPSAGINIADQTFPDIPIFKRELLSICGSPEKSHAARAAFALFEGYARIAEIPPDLWRPENQEKRAEWLAEKAPEPEPGQSYKLNDDYIPYLGKTHDSHEK